MEHHARYGDPWRGTRVLTRAPEELTQGTLIRLGEGVGKVVYASEHWVVPRNRPPSEILALILIWKLIRRLQGLLPFGLGRRILQEPSPQLRLIQFIMQAVVLTVPRSVWLMTHIGDIWREYRKRDRFGKAVAEQRLSGTRLVPQRITFPPTNVKVGEWPGLLCVHEATERVETTLNQRLADLAAAGDYAAIETWLNRFLELRQAGWRRGAFSVDAHLKNFGVSGDRVVLLDPGGLTDCWDDIEDRLSFEEDVAQPHVELGLGEILESRPDIAQRFDARWKAVVNPECVRSQWPE